MDSFYPNLNLGFPNKKSNVPMVSAYQSKRVMHRMIAFDWTKVDHINGDNLWHVKQVSSFLVQLDSWLKEINHMLFQRCIHFFLYFSLLILDVQLVATIQLTRETWMLWPMNHHINILICSVCYCHFNTGILCSFPPKWPHNFL